MKQNYNESLAKRGHGKWKAFLPCTLLLIGLLVGLNGAYAQEYFDGKLEMSKSFKPTNDDNSEGLLWLETYVTGAHVTHSVAVPSDIVLVLDMSYSMRDPFSSTDNTPRVQALQNSVRSFLTSIFDNDIEDAGVNGKVGHRVAVVAFAGGPTTSGWGQQTAYNGTRLLSTNSMQNYSGIVNNPTSSYYTEALKEITSNGAINTQLSSTTVGRIVSSNCQIGTYAQYGLDMAYNVLNNRTVRTYIDEEGVERDRGTSVVFFTDGYVGGDNTPDEFYIPYSTSSTSANQAAEADAAVYQANRIKSLIGTIDNTKRPAIYSVGIYPGADPHAAYRTNYSDQTGGSGANHYNGFYHDPDQGANGLMHMVSSDYDYVEGMTQPTYTTAGYFRTHTTLAENVAERFFYTDDEGVEHTSKFFKAADQAGLNQIFKQIASEAGTPPIEMTEATIIQDVVSTSFTLPDGADINTIEVYAVKCTYAEMDNQGNVSNCQFDTGDVYTDAHGNQYTYGTKTSSAGYLPLITSGENKGAVDEANAAGKENRLNSEGIVQLGYDDDGNRKINITGFNFKAMYCGLEGEPAAPRGRKLVIKIPIKVKEGVWGDDFITNGEMSFVQPNGVGQTYPFEVPVTNVLGSVWTEKVTTRPEGFPVIETGTETIDIDSPEKLAWFISEVNGRIHYTEENNVASHPQLNGRLTADIDMSAHNWVPIGAGYLCNNQDQYLKADGTVNYQLDPETGEIMTDPNGKKITLPAVNIAYEGTFDGNGHVITGLKNNASKFYKVVEGYDYSVVVFPGMFSNVTGTVKNVVVLDSDFHARNHRGEKETFKHFGIIADTLSTGGQIFNCEAVGRLACDNDITTVYTDPDTHEVLETQLERDSEIILGGLVGYNNGGTIHSSMAMPTLTGYTMGGMIGENKGSFTNGFTNGVYNYLDNKIDGAQIVKPVGGIAATNTSSISNCYVRFSRQSSNLDKATFGQVVGNGNFTEASCYTPRYSDDDYDDDGEHVLDRLDYTAWNSTIPKVGASANKYSNTRNPGHMRGDRSNDNMVGGSWHEEEVVDAQGESQGSLWVLIGGMPLLNKLNDGKGSGSSWKRTTAGSYAKSPNGGDINGDYPVLMFTGYTCLAGNNGGIGIDYATTLDEMLTRHNDYTLNTNSTWNNNKYKDTEVEVLKGGAINLFANETTSLGTSTEAGTVVYIDENVSLLQSTDADIEAYTGQTIIDYGSGYDQQSGNRWHNISSSLKNSMTGLTYDINVQVPSALGDNWDDFVAQYYEQTTDPETGEGGYTLNPNNPCRVKANTTNDDAALFPADMRQWKPFDFYTFFEPEYHWVNFRRNGGSHWHMDSPLTPIDYYYVLNGETTHDNETQLIPGKGYLLALHFEYFANWHMWNDGEGHESTKDRTLLQNRGTLNNGLVEIPVTASAPEWTGLKGYNLLGNPYQSYLDFDKFINDEVNSSVLSNSDYAKTYAVYDPSANGNKGAWLQYGENASPEALAASQYINMHQGFFIQVNGEESNVRFTNDMRTNEGTPNFRGSKHYPLVNFILTDHEGNSEIAVLEVGRPENGGSKKLNVGSLEGRISLRHDNQDFGILFRDITEGSQPLYFETEEDGTFTLSWNTANANFSSLTLVDNLTGVKYDMLANDSYTFQGRVTDYRSRFKVVIGRFTDVEENEETVTDNFAFFDGTDWVVNGQGQLTVTDMTGRTIYTANLTSDQNRVNLNGVANGIYLMRVANGQNVNVQKIIIK